MSTVKLFIPSIGMKMKLVKDTVITTPKTWTGLSYAHQAGHITSDEYRAISNASHKGKVAMPDIPMTFPKGTVIALNKIYVRNNGWGSDYVTVKVFDNPAFKYVVPVQLQDLMNFEVEILDKVQEDKADATKLVDTLAAAIDPGEVTYTFKYPALGDMTLLSVWKKGKNPKLPRDYRFLFKDAQGELSMVYLDHDNGIPFGACFDEVRSVNIVDENLIKNGPYNYYRCEDTCPAAVFENVVDAWAFTNPIVPSGKGTGLFERMHSIKNYSGSILKGTQIIG